MRWLAARYAIVSLMARGRSRFNRAFIAYSLLAGVGQAVVLAIVNSAAARGNNDARHLVLFCVAVGVYLLTQSEVISIAGLEFERVLHQIRTSIAQHIARAELESLEHIGRSEIYAGVNRETVIISQASSAIAVACQSATMIVCSAVYLERLSTTAFVLTCVSALVGVRAFLAKRDDATRLITEANRSQNEFFESMMHLIDGFKEVRLHEPRARALINRLRDISGELKTTKSKSERAFAEQFVVSQAVMYLQIGAVVFVLPALGPTLPGVVIQATAAVLFLVGPLANLVVTAPVFQRANVAAKNVLDLEARLARAEPPETTTPDRVTTLDRNIVLRDVLFQYDGHGGEPGFALGPLDLAIRPGEILFLVGGNGSGKSTLLRLLTGLYYPQAGAIEIGTTASSASRAGWYRSHFSAVFSDYHLFDRPYGMEDVDPERIRKGLEQMQLDRKVHLQDNRFSTLDLSSGQRKRLALLVALLEDRPVLVCDEWAAEQDPDFRRTFYTELLPSLRANGKTIIAATHDDRYFDIADRIVKLEYGVIVADRGRNDPVA